MIPEHKTDFEIILIPDVDIEHLTPCRTCDSQIPAEPIDISPSFRASIDRFLSMTVKACRCCYKIPDSSISGVL